MPQIMKFNALSSTGWRTEALLIALIVLILAGVDDVAAKYGFEVLQGTAAQLVKAGISLLAIATARARQAKASS